MSFSYNYSLQASYPSQRAYVPYQQPHIPTPSPIYSLPITNTTPSGALSPSSCFLEVRQQPKEALVTVKGKEKFRKPLDPPPMLELKVSSEIDPSQQFLQNPYLFVSVSLYKHDKDEPIEGTPFDILTGTLVSSLHRLKDVTNKDGAFFIFGDISIKVQGTYRLRFTLYELQPSYFTLADLEQHKDLERYQGAALDPPEYGTYQCLGHVLSDKFNVVLPKDFKGLEESTYLSRAFSDQGVRLRLRKEARGMMSNKRSIDAGNPTSDQSQQQQQQQPLAKKRREDSVESANPSSLMSGFYQNVSPFVNTPYLQSQGLQGQNMQNQGLQTPVRHDASYAWNLAYDPSFMGS